MDCAKCGKPVEGDRYENAVVDMDRNVPPHFDMRRPVPVVHFDCVEDPAHLRDDQFKKWAVWKIQTITAAASVQVHNHGDLVDALEELHPGTRAAYEHILLRG